MAKAAAKRSRVVYKHNQSPKSNNNRHYAKLHGWKFDMDWDTYRDACNFPMFPGDSPHKNNVDCHR